VTDVRTSNGVTKKPDRLPVLVRRVSSLLRPPRALRERKIGNRGDWYHLDRRDVFCFSRCCISEPAVAKIAATGDGSGDDAHGDCVDRGIVLPQRCGPAGNPGSHVRHWGYYCLLPIHALVRFISSHLHTREDSDGLNWKASTNGL